MIHQTRIFLACWLGQIWPSRLQASCRSTTRSNRVPGYHPQCFDKLSELTRIYYDQRALAILKANTPFSGSGPMGQKETDPVSRWQNHPVFHIPSEG